MYADVTPIIDKDGTKAEPADLQELHLKASRHLKKFPGRTQQIEGRPFIRFEDYCKWQGRKVKGNLLEKVEDGMIIATGMQLCEPLDLEELL